MSTTSPMGIEEPSPAEMSEALQQVLGSSLLQDSVRQSQFLRFVGEEALAGRGPDIKAWTIARHALEQPATFDPTSDPLVRVVAYRLRETLDSYYSGPGALDPVRIELPKGRYEPRFTYVGRADARRQGSARTIGPLLAVATFADELVGDHPSYLVAGLSESISAALSRQPAIQVIGPVSLPGDGDLDAEVERDRTLEADLLLAGSVRGDAGAIRLTVRLVDVASSVLLWAGSFDASGAQGHPFDLEDQLADKVATLLGDHLGIVAAARSSSARTTNPDVYQAILAYYAYARSLDKTEQPGVQAALEHALTLEPDNDLILAMLASLLMFQGVGDATGAPPSDDMHERALTLARRSQHLQPRQTMAAAVLAFGLLVSGDRSGASAAMTNVLSETTSQSVRSWCAVGLALCGEWDDGIAELRSTVSLNAHYPTWQRGFLALDALARGDTATALDEARRVETPGLVWGPLLRAAAYGAAGQHAEGLAQLALLGDIAETATNSDRFLSHMRLPNDVAAALADALGALNSNG